MARAIVGAMNRLIAVIDNPVREPGQVEALLSEVRGLADAELGFIASAVELRTHPAAQPAQPVAESWWLMESTVTPRPLFYAGHNKHSDGALKPTMTENAAQAVRFPDEWTAKYTLAHLLGIDVSGPRWTFAFMNSGYAVREHIFDYTPRALASPPPSPKTGEGSAIGGGPQPVGDVVVSWDAKGRIVAVTRQDDEGRILSVIAELDKPPIGGVPETQKGLTK